MAGLTNSQDSITRQRRLLLPARQRFRPPFEPRAQEPSDGRFTLAYPLTGRSYWSEQIYTLLLICCFLPLVRLIVI
jgi:hypothetical protein